MFGSPRYHPPLTLHQCCPRPPRQVSGKLHSVALRVYWASNSMISCFFRGRSDRVPALGRCRFSPSSFSYQCLLWTLRPFRAVPSYCPSHPVFFYSSWRRRGIAGPNSIPESFCALILSRRHPFFCQSGHSLSGSFVAKGKQVFLVGWRSSISWSINSSSTFSFFTRFVWGNSR